MTAQLSRIVYRIGNPENDQCHFTDQKDHADIAKNNGYEVSEYVLAGMDSDPVILYRERNPYNGMSTGWIELTQDEFDFIKENAGENAEFKTVYSAPPAPVAVPDFDEWSRRCKISLLLCDSEFREVADLTWNEACTAMLKAGPVTAATVPDGWKLVPLTPTAEMISSGITAHYEGSQSQVHDRPVTGPMECGYMAMLAASPAAPEQEV